MKKNYVMMPLSYYVWGKIGRWAQHDLFLWPVLSHEIGRTLFHSHFINKEMDSKNMNDFLQS